MKKRRIFSILSLALVLIFSTPNVKAGHYNPESSPNYYYSHCFDSSVDKTHVKYYISPSAKKDIYRIQGALKRWENLTAGTEVEFKFYETQYPYAANITFECDPQNWPSNVAPGSQGYVSYSNKLACKPPEYDYTTCYVHVSGQSDDLVRTYTHEIGHALGLGHPKDIKLYYSVMWPYNADVEDKEITKYKKNLPTADDLFQLKECYR